MSVFGLVCFDYGCILGRGVEGDKIISQSESQSGGLSTVDIGCSDLDLALQEAVGLI